MTSGEDFQFLQRLLLERSGMSLTSDKLYLVGSRLAPVAMKHGFRSVIDLLAKLRQSPDETLIRAVTEAMATHESLFFRDKLPFDQVTNVILPEIAARPSATKRIRAWSAACSSGQEAYSLAMTMRESSYNHSGWTFEIVGTDFVPDIVEKAQKGVYTQFELDRGVSPERRTRFFRPVGEHWSVSDELRGIVKFATHNLLHPAPQLGTFDLILCRNVMIYFDAATRRRVMAQLLDRLTEDGFVIVGSADLSAAMDAGLTYSPDHPGLFRRRVRKAA